MYPEAGKELPNVANAKLILICFGKVKRLCLFVGITTREQTWRQQTK